MTEGVIIKALSGFYFVEAAGRIITCKARGKFRKAQITPLVGDRVLVAESGDEGTVSEILPRKNTLLRPPVANIDMLVIIASNVIPVTVPYLIDRIAAVAEMIGCEPVICVNKSDMDPADELFDIYTKAGFKTIRTSAATGEGIRELESLIAGKCCAFTGNSGVGKSSILNALEPRFQIATGDVSDKLGRGRHTTRHVEMFKLSCGASVIDTPGFSAFDADVDELSEPKTIYLGFREFEEYIGRCRFLDCCHLKEDGCAITEAVSNGLISGARYESYARLMENAKQIKPWERKYKNK